MEIFLLNDIVVFLFIESILIVLMLISEFSVLKILKHWNFNLTTSLQYSLEKRNYLVNTIIQFTILSKLILFVFFIKSLNELSNVVPGSMCVAGVIGANSYGEFLLLFKIFTVFMLAIWLIINKLDLKSANFSYIRNKSLFFNFILLLVLVEFVLEFLFFNNIPLSVPVFCCSTIFKADALPFGFNQFSLAIAFYGLYLLSVLTNYMKAIVLSFLSNVLFLFIAYFAITYVFSIYIYVLPNHQCPFCILQHEYYYIGYVVWISLFVGVFFGIAPFIVESIINVKDKTLFSLSSFFNTIFVILCTFYIAIHYIKTGVFL